MPFQLGLPEVIVVLVIALLFSGSETAARGRPLTRTRNPRVQGRDVRQQPQRNPPHHKPCSTPHSTPTRRPRRTPRRPPTRRPSRRQSTRRPTNA